MRQLGFDLINSEVMQHDLTGLGFGKNVPHDCTITTEDHTEYKYTIRYAGRLSDVVGCKIDEHEHNPHMLAVDPSHETQGFFFFLEMSISPLYADELSLAQTIIDTALRKIEKNNQDLIASTWNIDAATNNDIEWSQTR